ncbi:MAG: hypothetical protein GY761_06165 [Hyphomicrobiales bacterium]|nr:hypothetical protein [Hyphomicrobiales bacterium]
MHPLKHRDNVVVSQGHSRYFSNRRHCIEACNSEQLVAHMEDIWELLRLRHEDLPRTANLVTGSFRTADIEQTIEYGAHGPKLFQVILVDGKKESNKQKRNNK